MKKYLSHLRTAAFCLLLLAALVYLLNRCIVLDTSAVRGETGFTWRGHHYVPYGGSNYQGGRTVARTTDGLTVTAIKGDPSHRFLVLSSFLDSELCVREDYEIPTEGKLNGVYWGTRKKIIDPDLRSAISSILTEFRADFIYETDSIYTKTESRHLHPVSFCFEDCPVGVDPYDSHMGKIDGEWVFARQASYREDENNGRIFTYDVYRIPEKYHEVLETYYIE